MNYELLSPAGDKESFIQAINNNANAVYIGGVLYGARAHAKNFSLEEIKEMIIYAHLRDVKVYVTVNIVIKDKEIKDALEYVKFLYLNDVDAIIVQDIGFAMLVRSMFPALALHASTQMNIHSALQAKFIKSLGFKRIILARECSLEMIKEIKKQVDIEIEVFVHGALCMSYSGNCYMSSFLGKRSGNRGRCAQPCRLEYNIKGVNKKGYILSTKDLLTINEIEELKKINVDSFKIEGRMKRPEYVGLVTKCYHSALFLKNSERDFSDKIKKMRLMYNRDFTKGYMFHEANSSFTNTLSNNHIGLRLGVVVKVDNNYCFIKLEDDLSLSDSIRITGKEEDGITVSSMYINECAVKKAKANDIVKVRCHKTVEKGSIVLKTTDKLLIDEVNSVSDKKIPIKGRIFVKEDRLALEIRCSEIIFTTLSTKTVQESASGSFESRISEQINKTNSTIYYFTSLVNECKNVFLPISEINDLRRRSLEQLDILRIEEKRNPHPITSDVKFTNPLSKITNDIIVVVNTVSQLEAAKKFSNIKIFTENKDLLSMDKRINYTSPRINVNDVDGDATQNYSFYNHEYMYSGVYMNVVNHYTAGLLVKNNVKMVGLSVELSKVEIKDLINNYKKTYNQDLNCYMMVYGYYELMIMKHCPINKLLNYKEMNCRECLKKQYYLTDRMGIDFPLIRSEGCNMKLLNSKRVSLLNDLSSIKEMGVTNIMLNFTIEDYDETVYIIEEYIKKFNGEEGMLGIDNVMFGHFNEGIM